jgi:hypothetical protein
MTRVEAIIEQTKSLEPRELADLTSRLREMEVAEVPRLSAEERQARWKALAGSITDEEGDAMLAVIEELFEQVNEPAG